MPHGPSQPLIAAIDQGTTSTRCLLVGEDGKPRATAQREFTQILPRSGWVEHDATEIWRSARAVLAEALSTIDADPASIAAVGIANQRETTVVWNRHTGKPVANALVWQDTRTDKLCSFLRKEFDIDQWTHTTGLPLSPYFSGPKISWILDNVDGARSSAERGELLFGTIDSWLIWNLSGGAKGDDGEPASHVTDVTNASRTMLMDLSRLEWDRQICDELNIPMTMLPAIVPSSGEVAKVAKRRFLGGVPITGVLGDQQAAAFGQSCFHAGETKNTYGTGNFLLLNTGDKIQRSRNGLVSTVAYQLGAQPPLYALEGSIAVTGSLVQWLRDNVGIISSSSEIETLAATVDGSQDCHFVPAFSGLLAPHWRPDARGAVVGLTRFHNKGHLARAALEATAFQTHEVIEAMAADAETTPTELRVDGGMVVNNLLMQFQADISGIPVVRPRVTETTAMGAAYAAGLTIGMWTDVDELRALWREERRFEPQMPEDERVSRLARWRKAVNRSLDWAETD